MSVNPSAMKQKLAYIAANRPVIVTKARVAFVAGAICAMPALTGEEFFEHKFVTTKDPDAIVDFYSTEDFLQILGIFPMAIHFVLSGVQWDTEKENTMTVHNAMEISFTLTEREEETEDGEKVVAFFQKRERFKNFIPFTPFVMWDQVQCYGYNRLENGTCEVFHRGEYFHGSLLVRIGVIMHSLYVIWATEKHINSPAFGAGDLEKQEVQRSNIPLHALGDFLNRLYIAQKIAIESGRLAAGASAEDAEKTLKTLSRLQNSPETAYVKTVQKAHLKKRLSSVEMGDAEAQKAVDLAMANLSLSKKGQAEAAAALQSVINHPDVKLEKEKPRYAGAFAARTLKGPAFEA